jgi:hypothetical protein
VACQRHKTCDGKDQLITTKENPMKRLSLAVSMFLALSACGPEEDVLTEDQAALVTMAECLAQPDPNPSTSYNEHMQYTLDAGVWGLFCSRYCNIQVANTCYTFSDVVEWELGPTDQGCGPTNSNWATNSVEVPVLVPVHDARVYGCGCDPTKWNCWQGGS